MVPVYFGMISNPSRIDAKRGDHFLEPDFLSGIISGLPVIRPESWNLQNRTSGPRVDRYLAMAQHPHRVTEPFAFTFLIRLDRRLAPASRALTRNPQQLDPVNSRGRNCFGGECRQRHAHRRFRRSPRKSSHRNECLDVSRR